MSNSRTRAAPPPLPCCPDSCLPFARCDLSMVKVAAAPAALSFPEWKLFVPATSNTGFFHPVKPYGCEQVIEHAGNSRRTSLISVFCGGGITDAPHSFTWFLCITPFDYFSHFYARQSRFSAKCIFPVTTP